ncbi:hypothetical protein QN372_21260, partial [Undibacterium sp. RTI2.1]|uniref:hypothetical protein n=1 Tax=unclassified Undibacterium TaxID=2630295 RepID=UPI002B223918
MIRKSRFEIEGAAISFADQYFCGVTRSPSSLTDTGPFHGNSGIRSIMRQKPSLRYPVRTSSSAVKGLETE